MSDVLAMDAFFDLLDDAEFDLRSVLEIEEFYEINTHDWEWMLP